MEYHFDTPQPPTLRVEITSGELQVHARDGGTVDVTLEPMGRDHERALQLIEQIRVEHSGDTVSVVYPKERGRLFGSRAEVRTIVHTPTGTTASVRAESADVRATGELGDTSVKTGSGDVEIERAAEVDLRTGSGDVRVGEVSGAARLKSGSGDIAVGTIHGTAQINAASGDVHVDSLDARASVSTASGDVVVGRSGGELEVQTASGDAAVERVGHGSLQVRAASGDLRIGIVDGVAVLLDVATVSGDVRSQLEATDAPAGGEGVRVRAHTTSGDITLMKVGA
jgi:hypothetical protein